MSGYTRKPWPCPGCGEPHHSHELCFECKALIELGTATRARHQEPDIMRYRTFSLHRGPSYFVVRTQKSLVDTTLRRLGRAMGALVERLREPQEGISLQLGGALLFDDEDRSAQLQGSAVYLQTPYREALNELHQAIRAALLAHYEAGVEHGSHLLTGLAAGDVTIDTFNAATTRKKEDGQ